MIVVLSGGTGGAKFVDGLRQVVPAKDLTIIVNTGDDLEWWGLTSPPTSTQSPTCSPDFSARNAAGECKVIPSFACMLWAS